MTMGKNGPSSTPSQDIIWLCQEIILAVKERDYYKLMYEKVEEQRIHFIQQSAECSGAGLEAIKELAGFASECLKNIEKDG